ncbi:MAG TPA: DUF2950 domain-containing protein [Burkholderiales bacterium]|nr:DUF2950 domain-containing protein [Burkholderiales bacterium]
MKIASGIPGGKALLAIALAAFLVLVAADAPAAGARRFASPEAAVDALVDALSRSDDAAAQAVLGPAGEKLLHSGDAAEDRGALLRFLAAYAARHRIAREGDAKAVLHVGEQDWPLPIPLVRKHGAWSFDTAAAAAEILDRRIGRNELNAIQVCLAIVDAQRDYASVDRDGSGIRSFARRLVSARGTKNGLYWPAAAGEPQSPLGPLVAQAAAEGRRGPKAGPHPVPYHGYYYRILTAQGPHAQNGARDYLVQGRMLGGFALVAYPARYGDSGVMTFIVNQAGVVYQRNLGAATAGTARAMRTFDPGPGWAPVPADGAGRR